MKVSRVFAVIAVLLVVGSAAAQAQAQMPNHQLAEQWVRCRQGQATGDCGAIQAEFNRRASEVRSQDVRIQRGEATPAAAAPAATPAAAPSASSTAPNSPAARPTPQRNAPDLSGSEIDPNCAGRQVIPLPGGYMCL